MNNVSMVSLRVVGFTLFLTIILCVANIWRHSFVSNSAVSDLSGFDKLIGTVGFLVFVVHLVEFLGLGTEKAESVEQQFAWAMILTSVFLGCYLAVSTVVLPPVVLGVASIGMLIFVQFGLTGTPARIATLSGIGLLTAVAAGM